MPKLKSFQELRRIREQAHKDLRIRLDTDTTITVGMGTCGIAAGARETMHAILEELKQRGIYAHVPVVRCIGICSKEPLVEIEQVGRPRVIYANVHPDMVPRLIEDHLVNGHVVEEWVFSRRSSE